MKRYNLKNIYYLKFELKKILLKKNILYFKKYSSEINKYHFFKKLNKNISKLSNKITKYTIL